MRSIRSFERSHVGRSATSRSSASRGAPAEQRFRNRMGWQFLPAHETHLQRDLAVSFTEDELASGKADYNFGGKPRARTRLGPASFARTLRVRFSTPTLWPVAWRW